MESEDVDQGPLHVNLEKNRTCSCLVMEGLVLIWDYAWMYHRSSYMAKE